MTCIIYLYVKCINVHLNNIYILHGVNNSFIYIHDTFPIFTSPLHNPNIVKKLDHHAYEKSRTTIISIPTKDVDY